MINQYYNYIPMKDMDYSYHQPLDLMIKAATHLQDQSNKNYAAIQDVPALLKVPVHEEDIQNRKLIESDYRKQIDDIVNKYKGNYSNATKDIYALKSKLSADISPSGRLGAMVDNYQRFNEYKKEIISDKELSNEEKSALLNHANLKFKSTGGTGQVDPITGHYNIFSGERLTPFNYVEFLNKLPEIKPNSDEEIVSTKEGMFIVDKKTGVKQVLQDRARSIAQSALASNPLFKENIMGKRRIGMPINENDINNAIEAFVQQRAYSQIDRDIKRTEDPSFDYNLKLQDLDLKKRKMSLMQNMLADDDTPPVVSFGIDASQYDDPGYEKLMPSTADKITSAGALMNEGAALDPEMQKYLKNNLTSSREQDQYKSFTYSNKFIYDNPRHKEAMENAARKIWGNKFDEMPVAERNKKLEEYQKDPVQSKIFRKYMSEYDKTAFEMKGNRELTMAGIPNQNVVKALASGFRNNKSVAQTFDYQGNPIGNLNKVAEEMGGKWGEKEGKEGHVVINVMGKALTGDNRGGSIVAELGVLQSDGTYKTKEILLKNRSLTNEGLYQQALQPLYGNAKAIGDFTISRYTGDNKSIQNIGNVKLMEETDSDIKGQLRAVVNDYNWLNPETDRMGNILKIDPIILGEGQYITFDKNKLTDQSGFLQGTYYNSKGQKKKVVFPEASRFHEQIIKNDPELKVTGESKKKKSIFNLIMGEDTDEF